MFFRNPPLGCTEVLRRSLQSSTVNQQQYLCVEILFCNVLKFSARMSYRSLPPDNTVRMYVCTGFRCSDNGVFLLHKTRIRCERYQTITPPILAVIKGFHNGGKSLEFLRTCGQPQERFKVSAVRLNEKNYARSFFCS